jgi:hypothetical protein
MLEAPLWIGWSAGSWGASWGEGIEVEAGTLTTGGHAPPLASRRYPQGRKRNLRLENEQARARIVRRQEEDLIIGL